MTTQFLTRRSRFVLALIAAPLVAPILLLVFFWLQHGGALYPGDATIVGVVGATSYIGFLVLGLPSIFVLWRSGKLNVMLVTLTGFLVGATLGQTIPSLLLRPPDVEILLDPFVLLIFGVFGGAAALSLGLLAGLKRS